MSYHNDIGSLSTTMLKHFIDNPRKYYHYYIARDRNPPGSTPAMDLGTIIHDVCLEKIPLSERVQLYPADCLKKNGAINPKPAGEFRESIAPALPCKLAEYSVYESILKAIDQHEELSGILSSEETIFEEPIYIESGGHKLRCKPDILWDAGTHLQLDDLKITNDPTPDAFGRTVKNFMYGLQDVHYSSIVSEHYDRAVKFRFWAVGNQWPYDIYSYEFDERSREIWAEQREYVLDAIARFKDKPSHREWHDDRKSSTQTLVAGPWDVPNLELEI